MASAKATADGNGNLSYSVFQQGVGLVDAGSALNSDQYACANRGLDVRADLNGTAHFSGLANQDADGNYYLMSVDGFLWSNSYEFENGEFVSSSASTASVNTWVDQE